MGTDIFSDYGSGSCSNNSTKSWHSQEPWPKFKSGLDRQRSSSFLELVNRCTLEDALEEFRQNGSDSPYNPEEERWKTHQADPLVGMGPSSQYLRQKSWPQPERSPAVQLPKHTNWRTSIEQDYLPVQPTEVPMEVSPPQYAINKQDQHAINQQDHYAINQQDAISEEQLRVLCSLPNDVLYSLLRELEGQGIERKVKRRQNELHQECRFCKNNGERESYYRSHPLKSGGRVACPVLRAFVCRRCGASGDGAHTAKYCPLATSDERKKSAAMMRSVRLASGRRRSIPSTELIRFGTTSRTALDDNQAYANYLDTPLDPLWAALEQKLML